MNNIKNLVLSSLILALTASTVFLGSNVYLKEQKSTAPLELPKQIEKSEFAQILSVVPSYTKKQVPYQSCLNQVEANISKKDKDGTTGGIIGGITGGVAGAVAGNQVNQGGAGTIIGAAVGLIGGAIAGNKIEKGYAKDEYEPSSGKVTVACTTKYKRVSEVVGYNVTYLYDGQQNTVLLSKKPKGKHVQIQSLG